jgi:hypothetical protein
VLITIMALPDSGNGCHTGVANLNNDVTCLNVQCSTLIISHEKSAVSLHSNTNTLLQFLLLMDEVTASVVILYSLSQMQN